MRQVLGTTLALLVAVLVVPSPAPACSLCGAGNFFQMKTLREDAGQAKLLLYGTLANPRLTAGGMGLTDLRIEKKLKTHDALGDKTSIEIPRYLPFNDPKDPPRFLVFCDVFEGKLDAWRGVPVKSAEAVDYLKGAMALDAKDRTGALLYFFRFLDHADREVSNDAFLEFAKANDEDVGRVATKLSADKLRGWLKDAKTPPERLGLYAFLLGANGSEQDAALLRSLLDKPGDRETGAYDGILCGYIQLRPKEGWNLAVELLRDGKKPFGVRFATLRALRFLYGWRPDDSRAKVLSALEAAIAQGEFADLAIEDLRRWQLWDLTRQVLELFGKKGFDAPLMRQALVRYALSCPKDEAKAFVAELRKKEPDLVRDVEELFQLDRK
jgi:hypothetical protein